MKEKENKDNKIDPPMIDPLNPIQLIDNGYRKICCGEFEVSSNVDDIFTLGDLLIQLLKREEVKKYLENFNQRKKSNDVKYLG